MVSAVTGSNSVLNTGSTSLLGSSNTTSTSTNSGVAGANSAISSTNKKLAEIEKQLAEFADQSVKSKKKSEAQSKINVQTFEKEVRKSPFATTSSATDIGTLVKDTTRLNVYSAIKKDDKGDVYRFKVQGGGETQLGVLGDPGLRVQVVTRFGGVVADSKEGLGSTTNNYKALEKGELKLAPGEYFLKVMNDGKTTKDAKGKVVESKNYALQLSQGVFRKDYDTVAQQPRAGDGVPQQSQQQLDLQNMIQASASYISSLPPIGTSATSKLNSALSSLFI